MNCQWYEQQLANDKIELWTNGRPSPALLAHARECERCAGFVDGELELRASLLELSETSQYAGPSANVKRNLLAELTALAPVPRRRTFALRFAFAAAAVLCLAIGVLYWRSARPQSTPVVAKQPAVQPQPVAPPQPAQSQAAIAVKDDKPVTVASVQRKPASRKPSAKPQTANDFYPVIMCDSLTCDSPTVAIRVELPASPLVNRGGGSSRTVMTDLLVGEDGLVRGVRVLQ
ncbi:hypothetical protein Acid345_3666 [Candidatus Koribacter versatilis Ellin345]|uniref:Uncharacterized protein n=1 Tax=Koribacter versatilis (strain Ellin345) TaxID=204669 RepID=Q1IKD3_KORVE|nr:hypothetical protein [Candidatus Koribacter versatilis]ABF42667.1 hypothetical protein Acid345_3666 [Candidatus Koribacter versatilis Ellin345]